MSSEAQKLASRRNGSRSNGPITHQGRAVSAKNSLKHGLLSRAILMPNEDAEAFAEFAEELGADLNPVGALESELAERIIGISWRQRRLSKIEMGILTLRYAAIEAKRTSQKMTEQISLEQRSSDGEPDPLEITIANREEFKQLVAENQLYDAAMTSDPATLGLAFVNDCQQENALQKLSRYEGSMERSLYRALHELQRLQAARQGRQVPLPVALDIDVSGAEPEAVEANGLDQTERQSA